MTIEELRTINTTVEILKKYLSLLVDHLDGDLEDSEYHAEECMFCIRHLKSLGIYSWIGLEEEIDNMSTLIIEARRIEVEMKQCGCRIRDIRKSS